MERVQGHSVKALLHQGSLEAAELEGMLTAVGRAVARLHDGGLVHGDLTTSNMMLRQADKQLVRGSVLVSCRVVCAAGGLHNVCELMGCDLSVTVWLTAPSFLPACLPGTAQVMIDFGLSYNTTLPEDRAVDLYVLERAFGSAHAEEGAAMVRCCPALPRRGQTSSGSCIGRDGMAEGKVKCRCLPCLPVCLPPSTMSMTSSVLLLPLDCCSLIVCWRRTGGRPSTGAPHLIDLQRVRYELTSGCTACLFAHGALGPALQDCGRVHSKVLSAARLAVLTACPQSGCAGASGQWWDDQASTETLAAAIVHTKCCFTDGMHCLVCMGCWAGGSQRVC